MSKSKNKNADKNKYLVNTDEIVNILNKYLVFNEENIHEYTIETYYSDLGEIIYELKYSNGAQWTEHIRNQTIMFAKDSGNGFIITSIEPINFKNIDYAEISYLNILYSFIIQSGQYSKYKYININNFKNF